MSGSPAAASSASQTAWATTSPSEWPASPSGWSIAIVPSISGRPGASRWASTPLPTLRPIAATPGSARGGEKRVMVS